MSLWEMEDNTNGKPKFVAQSSVEGDVVANVYGVSVDEMAAQEGKLAHPGWVKRTEGTGGRAGRVFQEVLVAASSMVPASVTDAADDTEYPDTVITITTDPANTSVAADADATFTVAATANYGTLTYQWQEDPATGTYADIDGEVSDTLVLTSVTADQNGYKYKCVLRVDSVVEETAEATLTVT